MCLIVLAYGVHKKYRLIVSPNRDELFNRPTAPLNIWEDIPEIIGGRDLQQGGTWMGFNRNGRFCIIDQCKKKSCIHET